MGTPCVEVPGVGEVDGPENRRLLAEPGDGELNLSATEGPVGDNKGSDKNIIIALDGALFSDKAKVLIFSFLSTKTYVVGTHHKCLGTSDKYPQHMF